MIFFGYVVFFSWFKIELVIFVSFWYYWCLILFILWRYYNFFFCIFVNINFMSVISLFWRYWICNNRWIYFWYIFNLILIVCIKIWNIRMFVKCDYCEFLFVFRILLNYCFVGGLWVWNWNIWKNIKLNFLFFCYFIVCWFNDVIGMNMGLRF